MTTHLPNTANSSLGYANTEAKHFQAVLRLAGELFSPDVLPRLLGDCVEPETLDSLLSDAWTRTDTIAVNWLATGGKRLRPFLCLAAYLAAGQEKSSANPTARLEEVVPDSVCRVALAMEILHKASLIHDDIEDHDLFRYGEETMHRKHGIPFAINTGDLLVALGYRLIAQEAPALGSRTVADIVSTLGDCHMRLCRGQGAELLWTERGRNQKLCPADITGLYAAKTSPAFEIALYGGIRMAGLTLAPEILRAYSRSLGVAFQIRNDLEDWQALDNRHVTDGRDQLAGRPTLLHVLALEAAGEVDKKTLTTPPAAGESADAYTQKIAEIFTRLGVFKQAAEQAALEQRRVRALAREVNPLGLSQLLVFLADVVAADTVSL